MGIDLLDFYRGKMSLRRLIILILELPPDSLTCQEQGRRLYGEVVRWDEKTAMTADIANGVRMMFYHLQMDNWNRGQQKGEKPEAPVLIHEPGWKPEEVEPATAVPSNAVGFFGLSVTSG